MVRRIGQWLAILACLFTSGCSATYPVVGSFDDYNEVFLGTVNANLMNGTSFIDVRARNSGAQCKGGSRVLHIPASNYIAGAFLISNSAKSGTSGTLYSAGSFTGGNRSVANGDTLNVIYTASV